MIIPKPQFMKLQDGSYTIPPQAGLRLDAAFAETRAGILSLLPMFTEGGDTLLIGYDDSLEEARYRLVCDGKGIAITAGGPHGALYGAASLRQLIEDGKLPCCEIEDAPHFAWRGQHFDMCRHFFPVDTVKTIIDVMALYKMNRLHMHISDDQGFRIESERFPKLNSIGSWRKSSAIKRGNGEVQDGIRHGGYYTKAEIAALVDYAKTRGVEIVPEIDLPGHTSAILAAYPALACFEQDTEVITRYGIQEFSAHILCAGNEAVYEFLFGLIDEIAALFPFPYFHIGGDEATKTEWKRCPLCQAKIRALDLKDERALQGWFLRRLVDHLQTIGKRAIIWNDGLTPLLTPDVVCQHWSPPAVEGERHSEAHVAAGGKLIMSAFRRLYFDHPYAMTPLKKAYSYQPSLKRMPAGAKDYVLGVESCLWTEWIEDEEKIFFNLLPRMTATATLGWCDPAGKDYKEFLRRLPRQYALYEELGLPYAKHKEKPGTLLERLRLTLRFYRKDAYVELRKSDA